ncbi:MAG: VanZ family protein [Planctomycetaceae bacterium]
MRRRLLAWTPAALWALLLLLLGSLPASRLPRGGILDLPHLDKAIHAGLYALLGLLAARPLPGARRAPLLGAALAACLLVGLLDEWNQSGVAGRQADPADLAADLAGGALGALVLARLRTSAARRRS